MLSTFRGNYVPCKIDSTTLSCYRTWKSYYI